MWKPHAEYNWNAAIITLGQAQPKTFGSSGTPNPTDDNEFQLTLFNNDTRKRTLSGHCKLRLPVLQERAKCHIKKFT